MNPLHLQTVLQFGFTTIFTISFLTAILYKVAQFLLLFSVRRCSKKFGFRLVDDHEDWNLYWTDFSVSLERVMDMKKYQVVMHFDFITIIKINVWSGPG